jgi:hypothetical protein
MVDVEKLGHTHAGRMWNGTADMEISGFLKSQTELTTM